MRIENKFSIGDQVFLKTDTEQLPFIVLEIYVSAIGLAYRIVNGTNGYTAYEIELSREKNTLMSLK